MPEERFVVRDIKDKFLWSLWTRYLVVALGLCLNIFGRAFFHPIWDLVFFVLAYNIFAHFFYQQNKIEKLGKFTAWVGLFTLFDTLAITYLIYITGWVESPYWFLYLVLIVLSGFGMFSYYSLMVFFIALFSTVFYLGLLVLTYSGIFPMYPAKLSLSPAELLNLVANKALFTSIAFFLFAIIIYYYAKLLEGTRQELLGKNRRYVEALTKFKDVDRMKNDFIANASHELRTPLAVVRENISLVKDGVVGEISEKQKKMLDSSRDHIDRLAGILDGLLDISKIESRSLKLDLQKVDVCCLGKEAITMLQKKASSKSILIETRFPDQLKSWLDQEQILRVFLNLIDNAVKYSPENSKIVVAIEEKAEHIRVSVKDNGAGIGEKDVPHLFERFVRFKHQVKGVGLGLSICKGIVEMHKGQMWVESKPGQGATFYFTLRKV